MAWKLKAAGVGACIVMLSGCAQNPYTGASQMSDAGAGALIGTTGGAVVGGLAGGKWGALIGAGAGAAVGGLIGHHMDKMNAELRQRLVGTGVQVKQVGNSVQLVMASDVTFKTNQSDIQSDFYPTLSSVAIVLKKYDDTNIEISGYTDNVGGAAYNQELSERRAAAVENYLRSQGLSGNRIFIRGYGERNPVARNNTAHGRSLNRRVVITLRPIG